MGKRWPRTVQGFQPNTHDYTGEQMDFLKMDEDEDWEDEDFEDDEDEDGEEEEEEF